MAKKKTIIGKDVIESLTSGMYEDSRFIFREYIQNSADAIDSAVNAGLFKNNSEGNIYIYIDKRSKKIRIEDDATGISIDQVEDVLRNIAQSPKERGVDKGFRGIGRLGGLGYCDELKFITSFSGEDSKSIMVWDANELNKIINDRTKKEEASKVIDKVTDVDLEPEDPKKHYFHVEMIGVNNPALLDKQSVMDYLKMVVPIPFPKGFHLKEIIYDDLKKNGLVLDEYNIFVNTDQLYKGYTSSIYDNNGKKKDEIKEIKTFTLNNSGNEILAWGWYSISNFDGAINKKNMARGIRLRKDNIQIGSETTLSKLHPHTKNQNYYFGEVHAFNKNLVPNARRDYLTENKYCQQLENELSKFFHKTLNQIFNRASNLRSADKAILALRNKQKEIEELKKNGVSNKKVLKKIEQELEQKREKAEKSRTFLANFKKRAESENNEIHKKLYDNIVTSNKINIKRTTTRLKNKLDEVPNRIDKYSKLNKKERKILIKVLEVIDATLPPDTAEVLKNKIDAKFK